MANVNYSAQIPVIRGALIGHLQAVDHLYGQLKIKFNSRTNLDSLRGVIDSPGDFAPLVVNVAFSLELILKMLSIQDKPDRGPRGHDLSKLWNALSTEIRDPAASRYVELLLSWDENDPVRYVAFGNGNLAEPEPESSLQKALSNMKDAFVEWRYMYEHFGTQKTLVFSLIEARCALDSLAYASGKFRGGIVVECSWGPEI